MNVVLSFVALLAAPGELPRLAVLPIEYEGVPASVIGPLTAVLTVELAARYDVLAPRDLESMLDFERRKDELGCDDATCFLEIGGALGVDRIVTTHVGVVGRTYVLDVAIINIRTRRSEARSYEAASGGPEALLQIARRSIRQLAAEAERVAAPAPQITAAPPRPADPRAWIITGAGAAVLIAGVAVHAAAEQSDNASQARTGAILIGSGAVVALVGLFGVGASD